MAGEAILKEDNFGESSLTTLEREQVSLFLTVLKKHIVAIARNEFKPQNLTVKRHNEGFVDCSISKILS
jgi:hypothetical protein